MHPRTERLRAIMAARKMTAAQVAEMLGRTPQTVRIWRCENTKRPIPPHTLAVLESKAAQ